MITKDMRDIIKQIKLEQKLEALEKRKHKTKGLKNDTCTRTTTQQR